MTIKRGAYNSEVKTTKPAGKPAQNGTPTGKGRTDPDGITRDKSDGFGGKLPRK
jgi:hypothetical protein